jgi:hypothetical protein
MMTVPSSVSACRLVSNFLTGLLFIWWWEGRCVKEAWEIGRRDDPDKMNQLRSSP